MPLRLSGNLQEFAGIQNVVRVKSALDFGVEGADFAGGGPGPPFLFGEADAVFAGNGAPELEDLREEIVERGFGAAFGAGRVEVDHDVDMNIAIPGVAEAGDGQAVFLLQLA